MTEFDIIFENDDFFVINKPCGLATQGGARISKSVDSIFADKLRRKVFLVHRLDRDTSGILLIAKNPKAAGELGKVLQNPETKKIYMAFSFGDITQNSGVWTDKIKSDGKFFDATTKFFKIRHEVLKNGEMSFDICEFSFEIKSGKTHQIRIHCALHGVPIIADDKHGNFSQNRMFAKTFGIKKLCLACTRMAFNFNGKSFEFSAEIPSHIKNLANLLSE